MTATSASPPVAIVTGGSRGIGSRSAERLAADGMAVIVNYVTNDAEANDTVATLTAAGGTAEAVPADVTDPNAVSALFDTAERRFGGVDVVVHAAGIMNPPTPAADVNFDVLDGVHRVNRINGFVV